MLILKIRLDPLGNDSSDEATDKCIDVNNNGNDNTDFGDVSDGSNDETDGEYDNDGRTQHKEAHYDTTLGLDINAS